MISGSSDILQRRKLSFKSGGDHTAPADKKPSAEVFNMWAKQMMPSENSYNTYDTHHHNEKRFTDVLRLVFQALSLIHSGENMVNEVTLYNWKIFDAHYHNEKDSQIF